VLEAIDLGAQLAVNLEAALDAFDAAERRVAELENALALAIPWIGHVGPSWATPEGKAKNKAMIDQAFEAATNCFPEGTRHIL
jgi:hypothetical protein